MGAEAVDAVQKSLIEEEIMFAVTEKAGEKIKEFLKDREDAQAIRIFLAGGG
jgi:hypothetical protein